MSGKTPKFFTECKSGHFLEGIDSVCNSIEEILSNQNRFCIVYKFDYLIFDFQFFSIKIHFLFFLLMYEYSEEDSL
jgi:hypothetical protein